MIHVRNLSLAYGKQVLFDEASFALNPKERIGLVGRNGHGKSTLFRILLGELPPDGGEIQIPRGYDVGHLSQHLHFSETSAIAECCRGLREEDAHEEWYARKILSGLGFSNDEIEAPPETLSGGYQVRLNLGKLLVSKPNLLLLDEPTNYLDIVAMRWLRGFLRNWPGELMLITHDRAFLDSVSTHTLAIHRRKMRKMEGGTEKMYDQIVMEEEIYEKTRLAEDKKRQKTELFITRFRAKARLAGLVQSRVKLLEKQEKKEKLEAIESLDFRFQAAPFEAKVMCEAKDLSFGYDAERAPLMKGLSFVVGRRDRIFVIGRNGRGKTTLLRLLAGELDPRGGWVRGHPLLKTGYFGQTNVDRLEPRRSVAEEILAANPECLPQRARTVAGILMFSGDAGDKRVEILSGGERARVLLGKILVSPSHLLLLDEPTNHLDMDSTEALAEAIDEFPGSAIVVTHNETLLHGLAERLIVFDRGQARVFEGTYQSFLDEIGWEDDLSPGAKKKAKAAAKREKPKRIHPPAPAAARESDGSRRIEEEISRLETELRETNDGLVSASATGDAAALASLGRRAKELRGRIERAYQELEESSGGDARAV